MPKIKTRKAAAKRVKISGGKAKKAFVAKAAKKHRLHQKSKRQKHFLRKGTKLALAPSMKKKMSRMLA
ncbi:MAG: 50S ribosomal protein L35, partial [Patescibacteria group bacterium]|nr:50S ribosomal protein L35 [Patescibacteria group bacterium]